MRNQPKDDAAETPDAAAKEIPNQSGMQILINWIILSLGLGGVAAVGAILPELL